MSEAFKIRGHRYIFCHTELGGYLLGAIRGHSTIHTSTSATLRYTLASSAITFVVRLQPLAILTDVHPVVAGQAVACARAIDFVR